MLRWGLRWDGQYPGCRGNGRVVLVGDMARTRRTPTPAPAVGSDVKSCPLVATALRLKLHLSSRRWGSLAFQMTYGKYISDSVPMTQWRALRPLAFFPITAPSEHGFDFGR